MAYFEKSGYCPACSNFTEYSTKGQPHQFASSVHEILGDREQMIVYDPIFKSWGNYPYASITEVLFGGSGVLGIHLASLLQAAIPNPEIIRRILIKDAMSPKMLGEDIYYKITTDEKFVDWAFYVGNIHKNDSPVVYKDHRRLIYDERYVVLVEDPGSGDIVISILKLPQKES